MSSMLPLGLIWPPPLGIHVISLGPRYSLAERGWETSFCPSSVSAGSSLYAPQHLLPETLTLPWGFSMLL